MRSLLVLLIIAAPAFAEPKKQIVDDQAKGLMRALKLAGVKPTATKDKWSWKVAELFCQSKDGADDKLASCECTVDKQKLVDAPALAVQQALVTAGIKEKYGMGGGRVNAYALSCDDDKGSKFQCEFAIEPK